MLLYFYHAVLLSCRLDVLSSFCVAVQQPTNQQPNNPTTQQTNNPTTNNLTIHFQLMWPGGMREAIKPDLAGERKAPCDLILQRCYMPLSEETDLTMLPSAVICCSPVCCYCLLLFTAACCCYVLLCKAICSRLLLFAMISCVSS